MQHLFQVNKVGLLGRYNYFFQACHDFNYNELKMPKSVSELRKEQIKNKILEGALIQVDTKKDVESDDHITVLGRQNDVRVRGGTNWVRLEFRDGDRYQDKCDNNFRSTEVMINCNPKVKFGNMRILHEENTDQSGSECYFLIEIESSLVCNVYYNSWFSNLLKFIFFAIVIYISLGFIYNKFINNNPRIPHSHYFKKYGNMSADLCDRFFRSKDLDERYQGIVDENDRPGFGNLGGGNVVDSQVTNTEIENDDHLLPM